MTGTSLTGEYITPEALAATAAASAGGAVLFLDYDGTLAHYYVQPDDAVLTADARAVLAELTNDERTRAVLVSGRPRQFLEEQAGRLPVDLAGEHGFVFRRNGSAHWQIFVDGSALSELRRFRMVLDGFVPRVPGSFVEEKEFSLVWHYRGSEPEYADIISICKAELEAVLPPVLRLSHANKSAEIRLRNGGKGAFLEWYLQNVLEGAPETLIAIGDDTTDEEMFPVINKHSGISIRVGPGETSAKFRLERPEHVWAFLHAFAVRRKIDS